MLLTRYADAPRYEAPNHRDVAAIRLQGFADGGPTNQWVGLSHFLPGGGAGPDATPFEKVYIVIDGELTVITDTGEEVLGSFDSCTIAPAEVREIVNRTPGVTTILTVIPYPEPAR